MSVIGEAATDIKYISFLGFLNFKRILEVLEFQKWWIGELFFLDGEGEKDS